MIAFVLLASGLSVVVMAAVMSASRTEAADADLTPDPLCTEQNGPLERVPEAIA